MNDRRKRPSRTLPTAWAVLVGVAVLSAVSAGAETSTGSGSSVPLFVQRGMPGAFHEVLKALEGEWLVDKRIYIAVGTREKPAVSSNMVAKRQWVAGGRHLLDITEGSLGGSPYYRLGVFGFSNIDHRYEWSTFDGLNANRMIYQGARVDEPSHTIVMTGVFTDQGLLGEKTVGKQIAMRTVIQIEDIDRHVIELYFRPGGSSELLIDRSVYTRIKR
jgi:hypothetical protein